MNLDEKVCMVTDQDSTDIVTRNEVKLKMKRYVPDDSNRLKCYSHILCGGSAENCRFWLFCVDLVNKVMKKQKQTKGKKHENPTGSNNNFNIEVSRAFTTHCAQLANATSEQETFWDFSLLFLDQ